MKMTPEQFQKALADKTLVQPLTLQGLTKEADEGTAIMFSIDSCETWTRIPLSLIEEIDVLRNVPCKDHSHPLVRLTLKRPSGDNAVFSALLESLLSHLRRADAESRAKASVQTPRSAAARSRRPLRYRPTAARSIDYIAGCKAMCYDSAYYVYGEGGGSDCNYAWEGCFSDLDYQCQDQGGVVLSTRVGTYCEEA